MRSKNGKQITTRQSTTLIQSKVKLTEPNKLIFTRVLLQYKWLKPQLEALYLHQFNLYWRQHKLKNIKDIYIKSIQSVNVQPIILKKYYKMAEISKQIKKNISKKSKEDGPKASLKSLLYKFMQQKNKRQIRQRQIYLLKLKLNPKLSQPKKQSNINIVTNKKKSISNKNQFKSPKPKSKKSNEQNGKNKLNNTKISPKKANHQEDYGLKCFHVKNKLSLNNLNSLNYQNQKSPPKPVHSKVNDYKHNHYFHSSRPKHKKTNSNTPQKSIKTSRKVSSKEVLFLKSQKLKTQMSKEKNKFLKFNKKIY